MNNRGDGEQVQDEWDEDYDKGKVKKTKMRNVDEQVSTNRHNSFQKLQDYRNYSKVNSLKVYPNISDAAI